MKPVIGLPTVSDGLSPGNSASVSFMERMNQSVSQKMAPMRVSSSIGSGMSFVTGESCCRPCVSSPSSSMNAPTFGAVEPCAQPV